MKKFVFLPKIEEEMEKEIETLVFPPYTESDYYSLLEEPRLPYGSRTNKLADLIRDALDESRMPQKELAMRVGTSQGRISEYIHGAVIPSLVMAARICRVLRIDPTDYIKICSEL